MLAPARGNLRFPLTVTSSYVGALKEHENVSNDTIVGFWLRHVSAVARRRNQQTGVRISLTPPNTNLHFETFISIKRKIKKNNTIKDIPNTILNKFSPLLTVSIATYIAKPPDNPDKNPEK